MSDARTLTVEPRRWRPQLVWVIPILAACVGLALMVQSYCSKGPRITISFQSADGLQVGKTLVRYRSIEIGRVSNVVLSPGEDGVELQAPFKLTNARPMPADVVKFDGDRMTYLRGLTGEEQVASDLTGFTNAVADNDFKVTATKTGYGVRIRADRPVTRLLWWSVPSTMGIEPYMDVKVAPGEGTHWTHTLDYYGPDDSK